MAERAEQPSHAAVQGRVPCRPGRPGHLPLLPPPYTSLASYHEVEWTRDELIFSAVKLAVRRGWFQVTRPSACRA